MKLPAQIIGDNKLRDLKICMDYIDGRSAEEIVVLRKFSISARRVQQILYANKQFINQNIAWPKSQRIHELQRLYKTVDGKTRKDPTDILEQLRREVEGDKPVVDQSQHTHITYHWSDDVVEDRNPLQATALPETHTRIEEAV